jgi:hypothetical protein
MLCRLVFLFALVFTNLGLAQHFLHAPYDSLPSGERYTHEMVVSGWAEYLSTAIDNELSKKLFYGGQITEGTKNRSFLNHRGINRFGGDISAEIEYRNHRMNVFGKEKYGLLIKGGYYNYGSLIYSKDLFGLAFYGNERYADQTIAFSGTRFTALSFQKMGIGLFEKAMKHSISLNFYTVSNYIDLNVFEGRMYQSGDMDSVHIAMDANLDLSLGSSKIKGYGAGLDLDFYLPVALNEKKTALIRFQAKDLGICYFNTPLTRYRSDTTVSYKGYTLDQLLSFDSNSSQPNIADTFAIDSTGIRKWRLLPAFIQVGKVITENDPARVQSFYGIRLYGLSGYVPMLYAGLHYNLGKFFDLGLSTAYGGFGGLRFGMYSNIKFGNFSLAVGSDNLTGIFQKNAKGESIALRLKCVF